MEIHNISFSYHKNEPTLQHITSEIKRGEITTIIGPNGSGKSTLLGVMSKNIAPTSGEILLDGKSIHLYKSKEFAKKLAVVHQQNEAPVDLTVEKLVWFGRLPHKRFLAQQNGEDEEAIEWALSCTNLQKKRSKTLAQLSGGERQRAWIAMSLAQRTSMLFLDEPTTYLDIFFQIEILELIKQLNKEHHLTIVMVLHDINQAIRYSDNVVVMKEGEIVASGPPKKVITEPMMKLTYGVDVVVKEDEEIGPYIVPVSI